MAFGEVVTLTLVFRCCGPDCDISYGMESTTGSRSVSLGWRLLALLPLAAGVVLGVISPKQTGRLAEIELLTVANLCVNVALIALGVYWIVVKKLTGLGNLRAHRFQHGSGVRPAHPTAHVLNSDSSAVGKT
jgi:hypothetical protein